jgi:hypothetical protein
MRTAAFASLLLAAPFASALAASPCEAPDHYLRAGTPGSLADGQAAPLVRPYVLGGIAAVALREEGGQRWLELAVHSVDDARRALAVPVAQAGASTVVGPVLASWQDRVWLRCAAGAPRA